MRLEMKRKIIFYPSISSLRIRSKGGQSARLKLHVLLSSPGACYDLLGYTMFAGVLVSVDQYSSRNKML